MSQRVAVITPTLRERRHLLLECAESVAAQTHRSVVHFTERDEHGEGPAVLRNRMAGSIRTEWLFFLDDDDLIDPTCIATLIAHSDEADVVYPWCRVTGREGFNPNAKFDKAKLRRANFIPVTALVRKSAFDAVGGFPLDWECEDWGLWCELMEAGYRFTCVPIELWTYRHGEWGNRSLVLAPMRQ